MIQIKNIISLFNGISCARVALDKLNMAVESYFSSEIDKYAVQVTKQNYPDTVEIGDVKSVEFSKVRRESTDKEYKLLHGKDLTTLLPFIDLLVGGSPCQDLSIAKKNRKGLKGERSSLFYEYVRILNEVKPRYFILENVNSMPKEDRDIISETLGVQPVMINAALVSAQQRKRLFWVGKLGVDGTYSQVHIPQPVDREIYLRDIIHEARGEDFDLEKYIVKGNHLEWVTDETRLKKKYTQLYGEKAITMTARQYANWNGNYLSVKVNQTGICFIYQRGRGNNKGGVKALDGKVPTLSSSKWQDNNHLLTNEYVRKLTPVECCRLQGLKDGYISGGVSDSQAYKMLGNAFNTDVVAHIISNLK